MFKRKMRQLIFIFTLFIYFISACVPITADPVYIAFGEVVNEDGEALNACELSRFYLEDGGLKFDYKEKISSVWKIYSAPPLKDAGRAFIKISCGDEYYPYHSSSFKDFHDREGYFYDFGVIVMKRKSVENFDNY